jgi:ELWxxDGT repeat protein
VSDGTSSGTKLLHHPLSRSDEFGSTLYALDHRVLFSGADDASGLEPWISDGTVEGTRLLQDVAPGGFSSYPQGFTRAGSWLFFVANDSVHGNELWSLPLLP